MSWRASLNPSTDFRENETATYKLYENPMAGLLWYSRIMLKNGLGFIYSPTIVLVGQGVS